LTHFQNYGIIYVSRGEKPLSHDPSGATVGSSNKRELRQGMG